MAQWCGSLSIAKAWSASLAPPVRGENAGRRPLRAIGDQEAAAVLAIAQVRVCVFVDPPVERPVPVAGVGDLPAQDRSRGVGRPHDALHLVLESRALASPAAAQPMGELRQRSDRTHQRLAQSAELAFAQRGAVEDDDRPFAFRDRARRAQRVVRAHVGDVHLRELVQGTFRQIAHARRRQGRDVVEAGGVEARPVRPRDV
jgi:hypothetical protein